MDNKPNIINDAKLQAYFNDINKRGLNPRPLLEKLGTIAFQAVEENFKQQGRPKWASLKRGTIEERNKSGYTGPILQKTGTLKRYITKKIPDTSAVVGTNLDYAAIHHYGGKINHPGGTKYGYYKGGGFGWKKKDNPKYMGITGPHTINIKARPFVHVTPEDIDEMVDETGDFLIEDQK